MCSRKSYEATIEKKDRHICCKTASAKYLAHRICYDLFRCVIGGTGTLGMPKAVAESGWLGLR